SRAYHYYGRASEYSVQERGWRENAAEGRLRREFCCECADYFAQLVGKYRRAMWRPWLPIAPDPPAPGVEAYLEQQRREAAKSHAPPESKLAGPLERDETSAELAPGTPGPAAVDDAPMPSAA